MSLSSRPGYRDQSEQRGKPVRRIAAVLVLVISLPALAQDAGVRIMGGYITGKDFMDMDGLEKRAYVAGVLEGMLLAPAFGAKNEDMDWFLACTAEVGVEDFRKHMFDYIRSRDELWNNRSPAKMYRAARDICLARAKKKP
jgi:hypothetical protein